MALRQSNAPLPARLQTCPEITKAKIPSVHLSRVNAPCACRLPVQVDTQSVSWNTSQHLQPLICFQTPTQMLHSLNQSIRIRDHGISVYSLAPSSPCASSEGDNFKSCLYQNDFVVLILQIPNMFLLLLQWGYVHGRKGHISPALLYSGHSFVGRSLYCLPAGCCDLFEEEEGILCASASAEKRWRPLDLVQSGYSDWYSRWFADDLGVYIIHIYILIPFSCEPVCSALPQPVRDQTRTSSGTQMRPQKAES